MCHLERQASRKYKTDRSSSPGRSSSDAPVLSPSDTHGYFVTALFTPELGSRCLFTWTSKKSFPVRFSPWPKAIQPLTLKRPCFKHHRGGTRTHLSPEPMPLPTTPISGCHCVCHGVKCTYMQMWASVQVRADEPSTPVCAQPGLFSYPWEAVICPVCPFTSHRLRTFCLL